MIAKDRWGKWKSQGGEVLSE